VKALEDSGEGVLKLDVVEQASMRGAETPLGLLQFTLKKSRPVSGFYCLGVWVFFPFKYFPVYLVYLEVCRLLLWF